MPSCMYVVATNVLEEIIPSIIQVQDIQDVANHLQDHWHHNPEDYNLQLSTTFVFRLFEQ